MERKEEKERSPKEDPNKTGSQFGKKVDAEASQKLTQRLYACYSESQILIPNEVPSFLSE